MSDDVRAAAERLLNDEDGIGVGIDSDYVAGGFAADDAVKVARAYLAEHPAGPSLVDSVRRETASLIRDVERRIGPACTREWIREQLDRIASQLERGSS